MGGAKSFRLSLLISRDSSVRAPSFHVNDRSPFSLALTDGVRSRHVQHLRAPVLLLDERRHVQLLLHSVLAFPLPHLSSFVAVADGISDCTRLVAALNSSIFVEHRLNGATQSLEAVGGCSGRVQFAFERFLLSLEVSNLLAELIYFVPRLHLLRLDSVQLLFFVL